MSEAVLTSQIETRDGIHLVHLAGPLDSATCAQFKDLLEPMVNQPHVRIVLDCEKVTYVNNSGLLLLLRHQRMALHRLSFLGIAALNPPNLKVVGLFGLGRLLKLHATVAEALRAAAKL